MLRLARLLTALLLTGCAAFEPDEFALRRQAIAALSTGVLDEAVTAALGPPDFTIWFRTSPDWFWTFHIYRTRPGPAVEEPRQDEAAFTPLRFESGGRALGTPPHLTAKGWDTFRLAESRRYYRGP